MTDALAVPWPAKSVITPKNIPSGSSAGSSVPFTAPRTSSMSVIFMSITSYMSRTRAPTVPAL